MKHLNEAMKTCAFSSYTRLNNPNPPEEYISIDANELSFKIQDGPIKECGVNGIQITDVLEYVKEVYKSLNNAYPCRENSLTITKIEEALHWQEARTKDREKRGVEGLNKA